MVGGGGAWVVVVGELTGTVAGAAVELGADTMGTTTVTNVVDAATGATDDDVVVVGVVVVDPRSSGGEVVSVLAVI